MKVVPKQNENVDNNLYLESDMLLSLSQQEEHQYGIYIVNAWNVNGFKSLYNTLFRQNVIDSVYADFWILTETHAKEEKEIVLDNFTVYQFNRPCTKTRASGGIAIAINKTIMKSHSIISILRYKDGQMGIKLKCNLNDMLIGVLGFYLSPDSYIYGQDPESFFNYAASL